MSLLKNKTNPLKGINKGKEANKKRGKRK